MNAQVFDETVKAFMKNSPYKPFTIVLVNGDRYEVDHPSAIIARDGVAVYLAPGGIPVLFDHEGVSQVIGDLMGQANA